MTTPKEALEEAKRLYDLLALSPLAMAAKYGPDFEPPTDEEYLEMRAMIKAAIPVAELHEEIVRVIQKNPSVFIKSFYGEGIINSTHKKLAVLLTQLEALK